MLVEFRIACHYHLISHGVNVLISMRVVPCVSGACSFFLCTNIPGTWYYLVVVYLVQLKLYIWYPHQHPVSLLILHPTRHWHKLCETTRQEILVILVYSPEYVHTTTIKMYGVHLKYSRKRRFYWYQAIYQCIMPGR